MSPNTTSFSVCSNPTQKRDHKDTQSVNSLAKDAHYQLIIINGIAYLQLQHNDSPSNNMEPPHKFQKLN